MKFGSLDFFDRILAYSCRKDVGRLSRVVEQRENARVGGGGGGKEIRSGEDGVMCRLEENDNT